MSPFINQHHNSDLWFSPQFPKPIAVRLVHEEPKQPSLAPRDPFHLGEQTGQLPNLHPVHPPAQLLNPQRLLAADQPVVLTDQCNDLVHQVVPLEVQGSRSIHHLLDEACQGAELTQQVLVE